MIRPVPRLLAILGLVAAALLAAPAVAQWDDAPADSLAAAADSLAAEEEMSAIDRALLRAQQGQTGAMGSEPSTPGGPFFKGFTNKPQVGSRANVRQYTYYWELATDLKMQRNSSVRNNLDWSWDEYRRQDKTVEKWNNQFLYGLGDLVPAVMKLDARWNWSEDQTVNSAGVANLNKRDQKRLLVSALKPNLMLGPLINTVKVEGSLNDQVSINQNQENNFSEAILNGNLQSAYEISPELSVAGRIYGMTTSGDRQLGATTSPSSATGDSLGFGVYYGTEHAFGRAVVTRSNFNKNYLDFVRNSNALIDTVGLTEQEKVVTESEINDALRVELINDFDFGPFGLISRLSRDTNDLDYAVSGVGLKSRQNDLVELGLTFAAGRDSFVVGYDWKWKWDDQRYKGATENRGRQNTKDRDLELLWFHRLFRETMLSTRYHQQLVQDIAENVWNENDKDRLQEDFSVKVERNWLGRFRASMVFAYSQTQDISIRASKSANNNVRDSYEIAPSYSWNIAPWLALDQSYRLYIQYTDYVFNYLDRVTRDDNYNKRGNLATRVTVKPTRRLAVTVRHDYNKRFNATKGGDNPQGGFFYSRDLNQRISKIDLGIVFEAAPGATIEGATYRTRDDKTTFAQETTRESTNLSGEIWVGCRVKQKWGGKKPLELSALVRKYNAFGPSVTETSADYWEADVWLKWSF